MKNLIYCVVPNLDGKRLLNDCLESLLSQNEPSKIIVVDNGSTDGSQDLITKNYPQVILLELDKNYGFAGGVNAGIKLAINEGAELVALINNDAVAKKTWLQYLVEKINKTPEAGVVTSKILRSDKSRLDSTGDFYSIWGLPFPRGRNEVDSKQYDNQTEVFGASGGASIYRVKMLDQIGLFDEDFFAYFEDVDISFRAQLAGWKVFYEPKAIVYHELSATSSRMGTFSLYHSSKNFVLLYTKDMPFKLYLKYLPLFSLQLSRWFLTSTVRGNSGTFLKGVYSALVMTPQTIKKRRQIQKSRAVPAAYIDSILYHHRPPKPPKTETRT